jgi:hypothetical protein
MPQTFNVASNAMVIITLSMVVSGGLLVLVIQGAPSIF